MDQELIDDLFVELSSDFPDTAKLHDDKGIELKTASGKEVSPRVVVMENLEEGIYHAAIIWPYPTWGIEAIANVLHEKISNLRDDVGILSGHLEHDEVYDKDESTFSGTVYLYAESLTQADYSRQDARDIFEAHGYSLRIRDDSYRESLSRDGEWDVFISHDSADSDFASAVHGELTRRRIQSWYDEAVLDPGDSLTKEIDEGLSKSQHAILIVSESFMENVGWASDEWQGIRSLSVAEDYNVIIPVWYNVTSDQVREFSPFLYQKKAIEASSVEDAADVADEVKTVIPD